jgi:hypothetical protein
VLAPIAKAIGDGDLATARPALEAFRLADVRAASDANTVIVTGAPSIARAIDRTLWIPQKVEIPQLPHFDLRPKPKRSAGSSLGVLGAMAVLAAMGRTCASTSTSHSYDVPHIQLPKFEPPHINYEELERLSKMRYDLDLWSPPKFVTVPFGAESSAELINELRTQAHVLATADMTSPDQKLAANDLEAAVNTIDCAGLRDALTRFNAAPDRDDALRNHYAHMYAKAIDARVQLVCSMRPAKGKPKPPKPKKPRDVTFEPLEVSR